MELNVFGNLPRVGEEIPDDLTQLAADVLRQYILEDNLKKDDTDEMLERLMRFSEEYLRRFMDVIHLNESGVKDAVSIWQGKQNDVFADHAKAYQPLYAQIGHMIEAPYFMTNWSVCFMVDSCLKVCEISKVEDYASASKEKLDQINYVLRFGENFLQHYHAMVTK